MNSKHKRRWKRLAWIVVGAALVATVAVAYRPAPRAVEVGQVVTGPMQVTIDEDGEVRAHDRFIVAAPVAGILSRIELHDGDIVNRGQPVATLRPLPLDPRAREELTARVRTAEAHLREAEQFVAQAETAHTQARRDLTRAEALLPHGDIPQRTYDNARNAVQSAASGVEAARFRAKAAAADLEAARAGLIALDASRPDQDRIVVVRAPVRGPVLRVLEKSEHIVQPGTPLLTLGDSSKLEVVIDVLSTDAVQISRGMTVLLEGWGGSKPLRARVRTVEPYAFTKVSTLGVEEQRVNIIADFVDPAGPLGDGYRVEARIIVWHSASARKVPASAVFRTGSEWSVFALEQDRARTRGVGLGRRNASEVEVLEGLEAGARVILHPPNELRDGERVQAR